MKWDNDEYKDLKHAIFDVIRFYLKKAHGEKVSVAMLYNAIDQLFECLISEENK